MDNILKQIQGKGELIYTQDEANELNEMIEKAKGFYPRNKEDEKMQSSLMKNLEKLQKLITDYAGAIDLVMLSGNIPTQTEIEKLNGQFATISKLEKQVIIDLKTIELKYE